MIDEKEALRLINEEGADAYLLLNEANPNYGKRFNRLCRTMRELLRDVKTDFPDAEYYTASGGFNLLIGNSHDHRGNAQQELSAIGGVGVKVGDGDW